MRRRPAFHDSRILRRLPRLRRALHRGRAALADFRAGGPRHALPLFAALGAVLLAALVATTAAGGSAGFPTTGAPPGTPVPSRSAQGTTPTAPVDASGPDGATPDAPVSGAASPAASASPPPAPGAAGTPTDAPGPWIGRDCTDGTAGAEALAPLRTEASLADAADRFGARLDALRAAMADTPFAFEEIPLDAGTGVRAFVLAKSVAGAANLNGFFYFLYDPTAPDDGIAPLVLVVDRLFPEEDRARVVADRTFSSPVVERTLRAAVAAALGEAEGKIASDFVLALYRTAFAARLDGAAPEDVRRSLALPETTVVFRDAYMTYVEFLPGGAP